MKPILDTFIPGIPAPGGSKRAFVINGRANIVDDAKRNAPWRQAVAFGVRRVYRNDPLRCPLAVAATFVMPRIKAHFRTGKRAGELRPDAPAYHPVKPDATKLWRAAEDALTGIVWHDDACIVRQSVEKVYGDRPGLHLRVMHATPDTAAA